MGAERFLKSAVQGRDFLNSSCHRGRSTHRDVCKEWQRRGVREEGRTVQTIYLQIMGIIYFLYSLFKFSLNLSPFSQVWITMYLQAALPQGRESHFYGN